MSDSSPSLTLPAKRLLRSNCSDIPSPESKIQKVSAVCCYAENKDVLKSSQTATEGDVAALKASADPKNLDGNKASAEHKRNDDVENRVANDANDCASSPELIFNCKPEKIRQITSDVRNLLDFCEKSVAGNVPVLKPELSMETEEIKGKGVADNILDDAILDQNSNDSSTGKVKADDEGLSKSVEKVHSGIRINWQDDGSEIDIVSPADWNTLQSHVKHNNDEIKVASGKRGINPENQAELKNMVKFEKAKIADFVDLGSSGDAESGQQFGENCEIIEIESQPKLQQDISAEMLREDVNTVESSINDDIISSNDRNLVNRIMVQPDHPEAIKAKEALNLFDKYYTELLNNLENTKGKGTTKTFSFKALDRLKVEKKVISLEKPFGHIPGVEIGDMFRFRVELLITGLHCQMVRGIYFVKLDEKIFATSVVDSGRYENEAKTGDVLIYSGEGGRNSKHPQSQKDQKLENGNLALVNSKEMGYPVRVTFKKSVKHTTGRGYEYVYDGLYTVNKYWEERESNLVYKFELHRIPGQPRPREVKCRDVCVLDDLSDGLEKMKIRVVNDLDGDRPLPFIYMAKMVYPDFSELINPPGCDCVDGCSDLHPCQCVKMNGVEIPFNEEGAIIMKKPIIHECGPQCKCPSTCMNRVSQLGPKYPLELFKTKSVGWGVRSQRAISSGSFICEYVGELLRDYDKDERIGGDEYLFDIYNDDINKDGFAIDAQKKGNIGRFLNHSCNPNLYAQEVLYDHDDKRKPHIMFFATKNIRPLQELTYDYNYKLDHVRDKNGNIKRKDCHCGARKCSGRMY